jgi:hypothetical protein
VRGELGQPPDDVPRGQPALELGLGGAGLILVPPERRASPRREQRLDQRATLRLERVNGGPERLGGADPGREQGRLAGTGLGGELLQPHRLGPDGVPLRRVPLDEVGRPAEPGGLDAGIPQRSRGGTQSFSEAVQAAEQDPGRAR